ncbi:MAG: GAF domain-containing protein [Syntrophales bacterium]|nr:GAF domain-containing protein [Syntrophales bacterium]
MQAWYTRTLQEYCQAQGTGMHCDVAQAGVLVDCIHQRKPVIHNDHAALSHRGGLPAGHAALVRELIVPFFRDDLIVAVLGIGNKTEDYTEKDIDVVAYFADVAWRLPRRSSRTIPTGRAP